MGKSRHLRTPPAATPDWLLRLVFFVTCCLLVAVPLVWSLASYEVFRGPKRLLAMACWLVLAGITLCRSWTRAAWRDPWWLAWGGILAGAVLSAPFSGQPLRVLATAAPVGVVALGWGALRWLEMQQRRTLAALVVASGVVQAILAAIFAVPRWQPEGFALFSRLEGRFAWIGTLGNPADVALFLLLPCVLAMARALGRPQQRGRWAGMALVMAAAIVATRTVSVVIALVAGAAVLLWRALPSRSRLPGLATAAALVLAVVLASPLRVRLGEVVEQAQGGKWAWLGSGRLAGFGAALGMLASHPLTGVGFGLFEAHSFRYQSEDVLAERSQVLGLETGFGEAHNELLQHAAETGLVGVGLAAAGFWLAWRRRRPAPDSLPGAEGLLVAAGIIALAQFPLHQAATAAQWVVLAALALPPQPLPAAANGWRRPVAVGLALAVVGVGGLWLGRLWHLAILLRQAQTLDQLLRAGKLQAEQVAPLAQAALTNLETAVRWAPYNWRAAVLMGDLALLARDTNRALQLFEKALALAERPETHFDVGVALLACGDSARALPHLERAVRLNPAVFKQIHDPTAAQALRQRLEATGYASRHPWVFATD